VAVKRAVYLYFSKSRHSRPAAWGGKPVALVNFSTQQYINLVARRHFELFGAAEVFAFAASLIGAGLGGPPEEAEVPIAFARKPAVSSRDLIFSRASLSQHLLGVLPRVALWAEWRFCPLFWALRLFEPNLLGTHH
jgi:hypothetical protein